MLLENRRPASGRSHPRRRQGSFRKRREGRIALRIVTIVVTLGFSYLALHGLNLRQAWRALRASDYWWLVPALVAFVLGTVARALRWRSLFAPARRPTRSTALNAMLIGYLYNNILPARAGEAARIFVLTQRSHLAAAEITGTVIVERLCDILTILVVFMVAEPWLPHVSWFATAAVVAVALTVGLIGAAAILAIFGDRPLRTLLKPLLRFGLSADLADRLVAEFVGGLTGLRHSAVAAEAMAWSILSWLLSMLCAYLVAVAFHLQVPFGAGVLVMVAVGLGNILPAPPAAVGIFEGATLLALEAFHVAHSPALSYALVLHLVNFVPFLLAGAWLLRHNARNQARVEAVARVAA